MNLFPAHAGNAAAQNIERAAREIGIDPHQREWKAVEAGMKQYVRDRIAATRPLPAAPPPEVAAFLGKQEGAIQQIAQMIVAGPLPQWEVNLEKRFDAPLPNLLRHLSLVRVLIVAALQHQDAGRSDLAWNELHAATRLADGLFPRPELISQMIAVAEGVMVTGAMRQLPGAPPEWAMTWPEGNPAITMSHAMSVDAWLVYSPFQSAPTTDLFRSFADAGTKPSLPGRVFSFAISPYLRGSAANTAAAHRALLRDFARQPPCSQIFESPPLDELIPNWNRFGRVALPNDALATAYTRLGQLFAHLQGTRLILAARRERAATGAWPATLAIAPAPCPSVLWSYTRPSPTEILVAATSPLTVTKTPGALNLAQEHREK